MASAQNFWSRGAGFVEILQHLLQRWEKTTGYPMVLRSHTILANPAPGMPIGMNWLYFERKTMKIYNIIKQTSFYPKVMILQYLFFTSFAKESPGWKAGVPL